MTSPETVDVTIDDAVAIIMLNRPASLNAFNRELRRDLLHAIERVNANEAVRVVIVTGAGKGFCCGADLAEKTPPEQTVQDRLNLEYKPIMLGITNSPKPYIAAVNGPTAGIGCALALACDIVIMTPKSYLFLAFSAIGLLPDGGVSWHLNRQLGPRMAYEIMALGKKMSAAECVALGLANAVVEGEAATPSTDTSTPHDGFVHEALDYAKRLVARAPLSLRYTKQVMRETADKTLDEAISIEAEFQMIASHSEDFAEGKAAFLEKRSPVWSGK